MRSASAAALSVVFALSMLAPASAYATAPPNDNFAAAQSVVVGGNAVPGDLTSATIESNEPSQCGQSTRTVWYTIPVTDHGGLIIDVSGLTDPVIAIYKSGSSPFGLSAGICVAGAELAAPILPTVPVPFTEYIQVSDAGSGGGPFSISLSWVPTPANDNLTDARIVSGLPFDDSVDVRPASTERATLPTIGETNPCGGTWNRSVWYSFTASAPGILAIDPTGSTLGKLIVNVYSAAGANPGYAGLTWLTCTDSGAPIDIRIEAERTYYVQAIEGASPLPFGAGGTLKISLASIVVPSGVAALDSDNRGATPSTSYSTHLSQSYPLAQTFVPGRSGKLTYAQMTLFHFEIGDFPTQPITMDIRRTDAAGSPIGYPLASTTIPATAVTSFGINPGSLVVGVFASPAYVRAGTRYALVLTTTDPYSYAVTLDRSPGAYAGGTASYRWEPAGASPTPWYSLGADSLFATYIGDPDTTPPVLTLPADTTALATGPDGASVSYTASALDAVFGAAPVTCDHASGSTFAVGTTSVSCSAADPLGNTTSGSFTVAVLSTYPLMKTLTARWVWKAGVASELTSYLDAAATAEARGNMRAEAGNLDSYRSLLRAQTGKAVSAQDAATLIALSLEL